MVVIIINIMIDSSEKCILESWVLCVIEIHSNILWNLAAWVCV